MNKDQFENQLIGNLPEYLAKNHQKVLKKALFTKYSVNTSDKNHMKGGENMFIKKYLFAGLLVIVFIFGGLLLTINTHKSVPVITAPQVNAKEIVRKSLLKIEDIKSGQKITPEQKIMLNLQIQLERAEKAKDLTVISREEFDAQFPNSSLHISELSLNHSGLTEKPELPSSVTKILRFTHTQAVADDSGKITNHTYTHYIGVDDQNLPVITVSTIPLSEKPNGLG